MLESAFINTSKTHELFAGTPPLEAKKLLFSMAVTEGLGFGPGWSHKLDFIDISRVYFHTDSRRPVFIRLPLKITSQGW